MLKTISQYYRQKFILIIYSNYFIYKSSKITIRVSYYTFSDKSTTIEMCNNDKYSIMYIFWVSIIQSH